MLSPQPEALVRDQSAASVPEQPAAAPAAMSGAAARSYSAETKGASTSKLVYLSARVPKELRDELHHQAIREGRPLAQLVEDSVRLYLEQNAPT